MKSKLLFFLALVTYLAALRLGPDHFWWALVSFIASLLFAVGSGATKEYEALNPRNVIFIYSVLLLLGLFLVRESIRSSNDDYQFAEYLEVHRCIEKGIEAIGYTDLEYDRFSGESGGDEIMEMTYYCRATGRVLSRAEFDSGSFGTLTE